MPPSLFDDWCESQHLAPAPTRRLHVLAEKNGGRVSVASQIDQTIASHYEDPQRFSDRIKRLGYPRAAEVLKLMLPRSEKARSGHLGEILATEAVPAFLGKFTVPTKRLRWTDGRESALRGEDLLGLSRENNRVRFLKGESKSRKNLSPSTVADARKALDANDGRPSQHALGFIMQRLFDLQRDDLALVFEEFMLRKTIPKDQLVHLTFILSGNDASTALTDDLNSYAGGIEQHAVAMRIADHQEFIKQVYERMKSYAP